MVEKVIKTDSARVELKEIIKQFEDDQGHVFTAVNQLNLSIESGEMVTLLGPSGCGKTTTLRMIAGFEFPTSGKIMISNQDVSKLAPNNRDIGLVFQNYALFPHLTVFENVAYGLKIRNLSKDEVKKRSYRALETMKISELADRQPQQLSGGQQQRVALARTIVVEPRVLLFDEPLSNLDAKLREYMRDELRSIQQELGITSLYVTHDQSEAMAISDRVVIMNEGRLQQFDTPLNIYMRPANRFVANFMGKADFFEGKIREVYETNVAVEFVDQTILIKYAQDEMLRIGDKVDMVLRPEFWQIDEEGQFKGRVIRRVYLGDHVSYKIELGGQVITVSDYNYIEHGFLDSDDILHLNLKEEMVSILKRPSE